MPEKPPLRLLTIMESYGLPQGPRGETWIGSQTGDYALSISDLGTVLEPLSAYVDQMLVVSGINMQSHIKTNAGPTHDKLTAQVLTGSKPEGNGGPNMRHVHESIDVRIGDYLNEEYGLDSPRVYPHLLLSDYAESSKATYSFDTQGNQIRAISTPQNMVSSLFGDAGDPDQLQLDYASQQMALELVHGKVRQARSELMNVNKELVMDAYEQSVQDLADELELRAANICELPDLSGVPGGKNVNTIPYSFDSIYHAFACDLVSSVTYSIGGENINQFSHEFLYDQSHGDDSLRVLLRRNQHSASHRGDDVANKAHELVRRFQMQKLAETLDKMSATPDVRGGSILDNTVIFVSSTMSHNTHQRSNYAHLLIAGKNTNLRGGYHYDCADSPDVTQATDNDLLTTIAQGLTLPITTFGGFNGMNNVAVLNNGPITKMLKQEM